MVGLGIWELVILGIVGLFVVGGVAVVALLAISASRKSNKE